MIPTKPPPTLENPDEFSDEFKTFISRCLTKSPDLRPTALELLKVLVINQRIRLSIGETMILH
jgi:serine/threonine protein kinase